MSVAGLPPSGSPSVVMVMPGVIPSPSRAPVAAPIGRPSPTVVPAIAPTVVPAVPAVVPAVPAPGTIPRIVEPRVEPDVHHVGIVGTAHDVAGMRCVEAHQACCAVAVGIVFRFGPVAVGRRGVVVEVVVPVSAVVLVHVSVAVLPSVGPVVVVVGVVIGSNRRIGGLVGYVFLGGLRILLLFRRYEVHIIILSIAGNHQAAHQHHH